MIFLNFNVYSVIK